MPRKTNVLIGKSTGEQDKEDSFQASLQRLAYSTPKAPIPIRDGKWTSRFFFRMDVPPPDANLRDLMVAKKIDHIDAEIVARLDLYREEASGPIKTNLESVREFFLTEVAPLTLAASGGALQATDVIQRMVDSEVDPGIRGRFEQMVNRAAVLKMALFTLKYFNLPPEHLSQVMGIQVESETKTLRNLVEKLLEGQQQIEDRLRRQSGTGPVPRPTKH